MLRFACTPCERAHRALSVSQDWMVPDGVLQYHHTLRTSSRTRRLRNISSVGVRTCVRARARNVPYDVTTDTGGERNSV